MSKAYADELASNGVVPVVESMHVSNGVDVVYDPGGPSMTRQEFAEECDINLLMSRYEKYGTWPMRPNDTPPVYYDFEDLEVADLQGAMQVMIDAEAAFMRLPASVRREFDNNAVAFVEFAADPANIDKMREWGLAAPPEPVREPDARPAPVEAPPSSSPPASS